MLGKKLIKNLMLKLCFIVAGLLFGAYDAYSHNSYEDYRNYTSAIKVSVCLDQFPDKILFGYADFMNVLPDALDDSIEVPSAPILNPYAFSALTSGLLTYLTGGVGAAVLIGLIIDICTNGYVYAPHEYINMQIGTEDWQTKDGHITNVHKDALTVFDVPFFFHCDPYYDPRTGSTISTNTTDLGQANRIGRTWGYMPPSYPYCSNPKLTNSVKEVLKRSIGKIYMNLSNDKDGIDVTPSNPTVINLDGLIGAQAFYRLNNNSGKFETCIATNNTFIGIIIGCTSVSPIHDKRFDCNNVFSDDRFTSICQTTGRCAYFNQPRYDLHDLGANLPANNTLSWVGPDGTFVKNFLKSDMHLTSTAVGCIKDLLVRFFLGTSQADGTYINGKYRQFQDLFSPIALTVLTLYVSMVAINMLLKAYPENISRAEGVMYIIKFAIFYFFVIGDGWMSTGLFKSLLEIPNVVGGWFLEAQNMNDPLNVCYLTDGNGNNILGERAVGTMGHPTEGYSQVILSIWDLVDCKILNYLTLGSCNFSLSGLIVVWLIGACFLAFPTGVVLGIIMLVYAIFLILMLFRVASIFILSMFAIAILAFVSPIFFCFLLFDKTKDIFQSWAKMIFGYTIYPACLFAFLALVLATFDSVYYGFDKGSNIFATARDVQNACAGINSIFCTLVKHMNTANLCESNFGHMVDALIERYDIPFIGRFYVVRIEVILILFPSMLKIMFVAVIFYLFMATINAMLARLVDVIDLTSYAKENFIMDTFKIMSTIKKKVTQMK